MIRPYINNFLTKLLNNMDEQNFKFNYVWDSINSIENGTDYKRKTIYACANGQNSTAYGYVWKYCR